MDWWIVVGQPAIPFGHRADGILIESGRTPPLAGQRPSGRRAVHGERDHDQTLQPLPVDHRSFGAGHRVHHERVQGSQDHAHQFPRRRLPQEPGIGAAFRQSPARPGRRELRSHSQSCSQSRAAQDRWKSVDHPRRSGLLLNQSLILFFNF